MQSALADLAFQCLYAFRIQQSTTQSYTGDKPAAEAEAEGIKLKIIKLAEAARGFVSLPRRWAMERSFAWVARLRRLSRDYKRLPATLAALHLLAFACLLLSNLFRAIALNT